MKIRSQIVQNVNCWLILLTCVVVPHARGADEFEKARSELKQKYGVEPKRWQGWADEETERPLVTLFEKHAIKTGLSASMLYTFAIGEGLYQWIDLHTKNGKTDFSGDVDGFLYLGTDFFCTDVTRLIAEGVLRKDFKQGTDYTCAERVNEQGKKVPYGVFKGLDRAVESFAASVALRKKLFERDAKSLKLGAADGDQECFWIYAYYVDGEGDAKAHLEKTGLDFQKSKRTDIKERSLLRVSSWRYVQKFSIFKE